MNKHLKITNKTKKKKIDGVNEIGKENRNFR